MTQDDFPQHSTEDQDRREFLAACGRFAAVTPPVVTMLLSTTLTSEAVAKSGGRRVRGRGRKNGHRS